MLKRSSLALVLAITLAGGSCSSDDGAQKDGSATSSSSVIDRNTFNKTAAELYLPLFWTADENGNGAVDASELVVLWGFPGQDTSIEHWVKDGKLTPAFDAAWKKISERLEKGPSESGLDAKEKNRRALVREELAQGRPTVVLNDFSASSDEDKAIVKHLMDAAATIEAMHAEQMGVSGLMQKIPADDTASRMMFFRNQSPWCVAPKTETNAECGALADMPQKLSGLYPASIQTDPKFCDMLQARPDQKELMSPFVVVRESDDNQLKAVPYTEAFKNGMEQVAVSLEAAAAAIKSDDEAPFKAYLEAAATAFRTNDWDPANEAWAKMSVDNSKWYLRIAPDEVYFEPCSRKAGFHVSFARINPDSVEWQKKLDPVKTEMEKALAQLAGPPYTARDVSFHLPDFIDIVLNAGDSRSPHGATIGQSLPNWGPVANEGRGRTVAMTNLYTDKDSMDAMKVQVESIFCEESTALVDYAPKYGIMSTVLHEAAHNLGPAHEYKVNGKTDDEIFGGPLASTFEELKAQTAALYFAGWLAKKGVIDAETAQKARVRDMTWAFGHISRGMYTADGKPKPYSQLAAIQIGYLMQEGAASWDASATAANGSDKGCMKVHPEKLDSAIDKLAHEVLRIKGSGDKAGAEALKARFIDDNEEQKRMRATIAQRWLRTEKATFVYGIKL